MAELEAIQTVITQVTIKTATAAVMTLTGANIGPTSGNSIANV